MTKSIELLTEFVACIKNGGRVMHHLIAFIGDGEWS